MQFKITFSEEAKLKLKKLEQDKSKIGILKKSLGLYGN